MDISGRVYSCGVAHFYIIIIILYVNIMKL